MISVLTSLIVYVAAASLPTFAASGLGLAPDPLRQSLVTRT